MPRIGESITSTPSPPYSQHTRPHPLHGRTAVASASRTIPPLPTFSRPASNCGFTRITARSLPPRSSAAPAPPAPRGSTSVAEINDTSIARNAGAAHPPAAPAAAPPPQAAAHSSAPAESPRASRRRLLRDLPIAVSTASTRAAPCCSMQSVNPPVEAPISTHVTPVNRSPSAPAPPRASARPGSHTAGPTPAAGSPTADPPAFPACRSAAPPPAPARQNQRLRPLPRRRKPPVDQHLSSRIFAKPILPFASSCSALVVVPILRLQRTSATARRTTTLLFGYIECGSRSCSWRNTLPTVYSIDQKGSRRANLSSKLGAFNV